MKLSFLAVAPFAGIKRITQTAAVAAVVAGATLSLGIAGCASPSAEEDAETGDDAVTIASLVGGNFTLFGQPRAVPTGCDTIVRLGIDPSKVGKQAKLENAVLGFCEMFVAPDTREYKLRGLPGQDCGSKRYSGKRVGPGPASTIIITDHRTRTCRDMVDARIIVEETIDGVKRTLYSKDTTDPAPLPTLTSNWVSIAPKQCASNPWNAPGVAPGSGEGQDVAQYFAGKGVKIKKVGFVNPTAATAVCAACSCPRGDRLVVEADTLADAQKLVADHGFEALPMAVTTSPKQCGTNPWEGGTPAAAGDEPAALAAWAASKGAPLAEAGFVDNVTPVMVCMACSCARGDTAIAIPQASGGLGVLIGLGWNRTSR